MPLRHRCARKARRLSAACRKRSNSHSPVSRPNQFDAPISDYEGILVPWRRRADNHFWLQLPQAGGPAGALRGSGWASTHLELLPVKRTSVLTAAGAISPPGCTRRPAVLVPVKTSRYFLNAAHAAGLRRDPRLVPGHFLSDDLRWHRSTAPRCMNTATREKVIARTGIR